MKRVNKNKVTRVIYSCYDGGVAISLKLDNKDIPDKFDILKNYVPNHNFMATLEDFKKEYRNAEQIILCIDGNLEMWEEHSFKGGNSMRFFKLEEISEDDYISKTNDDAYESAEQSIIRVDNNLFIAINEDELDTIEIDLEECQSEDLN